MSLERQTTLFGPTLLLPRSPAMDFEKTMEAMSQNTSSFCHSHDRSTDTESLSTGDLQKPPGIAGVSLSTTDIQKCWGREKDGFRVSLLKIVQAQKDF